MDFLVIQWFTFVSYYWCCWRSAFHWLQTFPCKWIKRLKVWKAVKMFSLPKFLVCTTKGRTYNFIYTWLGDKKSSYVSSCGKVLGAVKIGFLRVLFLFLFLVFLFHHIRSEAFVLGHQLHHWRCSAAREFLVPCWLWLPAKEYLSFSWKIHIRKPFPPPLRCLRDTVSMARRAFTTEMAIGRLFWCLCRTLEMVGHSYSSSTHCCNIAKVSLDYINTSSDSFWQCPACIRALCCR